MKAVETYRGIKIETNGVRFFASVQMTASGVKREIHSTDLKIVKRDIRKALAEKQ